MLGIEGNKSEILLGLNVVVVYLTKMVSLSVHAMQRQTSDNNEAGVLIINSGENKNGIGFSHYKS